MDDSFAKGYANEGILVGVLRHFKEDKTILNITDASSGSIYWSLQNDGDYSVISCQSGNLGKRCTITKDMSDLNNCLKIDDEVYVDCFQMEELSNVKLEGCKIIIDGDMPIPARTKKSNSFSVLMSQDKYEDTESAKRFPCTSDSHHKTVRQNLEEWIGNLSNPLLFWHHFDVLTEKIFI